VSKARIQLMQPIIKGSAGVEYMQKAFADRYGPPANASASLPLTFQFISTSKNIVEQEWGEHLDSLSILPSAGQVCLGEQTCLAINNIASLKQQQPSLLVPNKLG
jgi:hypothetical protein